MEPGDPVFVARNPSAVAAHLEAGGVHLWRIPYRPELRRGPLLALLGAYLGVPASSVSVHDTPGGKPELAGSLVARNRGSRLEFNWSHSGTLALVALARDLPLGVDIEQLDKRPRVLEIARRYFDPGEAAALATLGDEARKRAFIALWCAKEAVLKAAGTGLSFGLSRLAFRLDDTARWQLAAADSALGSAAGWQVSGFLAAPAYRGALAWHGEAREVHAFQPTADAG